jgi:hypothetical protein
MITRRCSEIIRLALTMSQIQNTDALSWRDKIDMLNQSYVRLYDDINNSGDIYYSKEMDLSKPEPGNPHRIKLPKDFWKLLLVGCRGTLGEIIPIERAPNAGQYFSGYKIVNNEIIFNNPFAPLPLVVKYIPQPQTIQYPRPAVRLPGNATQAAYDSVNNAVILGSAGQITVIDNGSGNTVNKPIDGQYILAVSAGIIYVVKANGIYCFDYEGTELYSLSGTFDLYAHAIGWEPGIIVSTDGVTSKFMFDPMLADQSEPVASPDYWNYMNGTITKTVSDGVTSFVYEDEEVRDITAYFDGADSYVIADPFIYVNKGGDVTVYERLEETAIGPAIIGGGGRKGIVLGAEINNESGYGVIYRDYYTGLNLLGFADDTVMNYPKNIFFDFLTADLAVKFRIACDIPTGELPALADDYLSTLMKGLSQDAYMAQRINNVYQRGGL